MNGASEPGNLKDVGEEGRSRNGYHRLDNVQEPDDASGSARTHAWVSVREVNACMKHNPWKAHNLRSAKTVLENPRRIYRHIRPGESGETGWCFSRKLERVATRDGGTTEARHNTTFTVYLNRDCSVFEWGVEPADPDDPHSPDGARDGLGTPHGRFGVLVWEKD